MDSGTTPIPRHPIQPFPPPKGVHFQNALAPIPSMDGRDNKRWEQILPFPISENSEIASIHAAPSAIIPVGPVTVDKIRRGGY
jgi:hypothetical protein